MVHTELDRLIAQAMKLGQHLELAVLRALKTNFLEYSKAKNAKPLDEVAEIQIIKKMCDQRTESAKQYVEAGRLELAATEAEECNILKLFLPVEPEEEDIRNWMINHQYTSITKKEMGTIIKEIKNDYPSGDGKMISTIVNSYIQ